MLMSTAIPAVHCLDGSCSDRSPEGGQTPIPPDVTPSSVLLIQIFGLRIAGFVQPESVVQQQGLVCVHLEWEF